MRVSVAWCLLLLMFKKRKWTINSFTTNGENKLCLSLFSVLFFFQPDAKSFPNPHFTEAFSQVTRQKKVLIWCLSVAFHVSHVPHHYSLCIHSTSGAYLDPCLPAECTEQGTYKGKKYNFLGTGEYIKCKELILPLLNRTRPCPKKPCSFNAVYQPRIDYETVEFYGFSEYWYSMHDVLRIGGQYSASSMRQAVEVRFSILSKSLTSTDTTQRSYVGHAQGDQF